MRRLDEYLNDPEKTFKEGLEIYNDCKRDSRFDALFSKEEHKPGSIAFNMMITELKNILRIKGIPTPVDKKGKILPAITAAAVPGAKGKGKGDNTNSLRIDANPLIRVELLPDAMREKFERNQELVKLMAEKHAYLQDQGLNDVDAANAAEELEKMEEERTDNWAEIDAWWNANRESLEAEKKVVPMTQEQIGKAIKLLSDNINRASSDLDTVKPNVKAKREARIKEWEAQREVLKAKGKELRDAKKDTKE